MPLQGLQQVPGNPNAGQVVMQQEVVPVQQIGGGGVQYVQQQVPMNGQVMMQVPTPGPTVQQVIVRDQYGNVIGGGAQQPGIMVDPQEGERDQDRRDANVRKQAKAGAKRGPQVADVYLDGWLRK